MDKEVLEGDLPVEGELPSALDGMYVRNGPSPHPGVPVTGDFHWYGLRAAAQSDRKRVPHPGLP